MQRVKHVSSSEQRPAGIPHQRRMQQATPCPFPHLQDDLYTSFDTDLILEIFIHCQIGQQIDGIFEELGVIHVTTHGHDQLTQVGELGQEESGIWGM